MLFGELGEFAISLDDSRILGASWMAKAFEVNFCTVWKSIILELL